MKKNEKLSNEFDEIEYMIRIKNHYNVLSESEKKIADYILNNNESILDMSASVLAGKIGTSPATIIRFCRSLGFKGYTDFKYYMRHELLSPTYDSYQIKKGDSINVIKQKTLTLNKEVIDDTLMMLDSDSIERAVTALAEAENIVLYGEGGSGSIALSALNPFLQIGLNCSAYTDSFLQMVSASQLSKRDVAMGIAHSGRIKNTIDALKIAKEQGATTICITGYTNSPMTEYSDIILYISSKSSTLLSDLPAARISELCAISVLQMGVISKNFEKYSRNIDKSKKYFEIKRVQE